jgi:hypothetical protein
MTKPAAGQTDTEFQKLLEPLGLRVTAQMLRKGERILAAYNPNIDAADETVAQIIAETLAEGQRLSVSEVSKISSSDYE